MLFRHKPPITSAVANRARRRWVPSFPAPIAGIDLDTLPGLVFGDISGALTGLNREASVAMKLRVYIQSTGALLFESATLTTGTDGRLARYENAAFAAAFSYDIVAKRTSDGKVVAFQATATN